MDVNQLFLIFSLIAISTQSYVTYEAGNCNLIFSVPHGGREEPSTIPERTVCDAKPYRGCLLQDGTCDYRHDGSRTPDDCQCNTQNYECKVSYLRDSFTREIAVGVRDKIISTTNKSPYMIINELKRNKMDANRDKSVATFGNAAAEVAWEEYHININSAINMFEGPALLIDFHGQSHKQGWTEFGYTISGRDLNDGTFRRFDSTISNLGARKCGNDDDCFDELLRGTKSIGYMLQTKLDEKNRNYRTIPSPGNRGPGSASYFSGGYNIKRYGSKGSLNQWDAIQMEMPKQQRWSNRSRGPYITALATSIIEFMELNYNW